MRIAEDDPRSHRDELVDEEQTVLEHLLEDQDRSPRLCGDGERDRRQVGGERRPRAVLELRNLSAEIVLDHQVLIGRDVQGRLAQLHTHAEPLERRHDRREVSRHDVLDRHVAPCHCGEADEAAHLDVIGCDRPLAAAQPVDAVDAQHVRRDPLDLRAERHEEPAEILDVRLASGVSDHGLARSE